MRNCILHLWCLFFLVNMQACAATSREPDASVKQVESAPCFGVLDTDENRNATPQLLSLVVYRHANGSLQEIWGFRLPHRQPLPPIECVRYGYAPHGAQIMTIARPLEAGQLYSVFIGAKPADDGSAIRGFSRYFCVGRSIAGKPIQVVELDAPNLAPPPTSCAP